MNRSDSGPAFDTAPAGNRRGGRSGLVLAVIGLGLFILVGLDSLSYPWAFAWMRPISGAPTLVGEWYGELTTPTGRRQWIALDLDAYLGRCTSRCPRIEGMARVCDARGLRDYEGDGRTADWRGTRFDLNLRASDERHEGMRVITLRAESAADVLHATAQLETGSSTASIEVDRHGAVVRPPGHPDTLSPINVVLRRGSDHDFDLACRRLALPRAPMHDRRAS